MIFIKGELFFSFKWKDNIVEKIENRREESDVMQKNKNKINTLQEITQKTRGKKIQKKASIQYPLFDQPLSMNEKKEKRIETGKENI